METTQHAILNAIKTAPLNVLPDDMATTATCATRSYATLRPADAVAHLGERIASEIDAFERETSLRVAAIKLKREKETETLLKAQCHVRS